MVPEIVTGIARVSELQKSSYTILPGATNVPQIIAFVDACFGSSACEKDASDLIAAMLIAVARVRRHPLGFHEFAAAVLDHGIERCMTVFVQRGKRLPVLSYAQTSIYAQWPTTRREKALATALEVLRLYPSLPNFVVRRPESKVGSGT
ncbi:hypothetical protein [Rhizobium sp. NXC24]|uniref:hypothetical protein n=1 Tax=Rhizobium sp. NXC24 TaxID=2048897 RepID=UPI000CDF422D|nr:hypothetical protein [Rhizobium sp. NXC24]AVA23906.1 hypothetical protein NXC24_PA00263 [Rhizobium sp. NXC24]